LCKNADFIQECFDRIRLVGMTKLLRQYLPHASNVGIMLLGGAYAVSRMEDSRHDGAILVFLMGFFAAYYIVRWNDLLFKFSSNLMATHAVEHMLKPIAERMSAQQSKVDK
jgi:hypothetical protein